MKIIGVKVKIIYFFDFLVGVVLFNHGVDTFKINKGDRIAQMIITKITDTELVEVDTLTETRRGEKGFGSTGMNSKEEK